VDLEHKRITFTVEAGEGVDVRVRGVQVSPRAGYPIEVELNHQGARLRGAPTMDDVRGQRRSDGTLLTASMPTIALEF
ncbi:hypothetical protein ACC691_41270, partial [Rhizobium johnstonii]|uniref:hypothetical protein n=1 Tax=Rhizobium johnstonii TaxID=3019933 RepID=UPI003F97985C